MFDLESLMYDLKMTQSELATVLNVSQTAISKVKNGKMDIPEAWLDHLNEKYNIITTKYYKAEIAADPQEVYQVKENNTDSLIKSLLNMSESNKILAESVRKAIENNSILINKLHREMEHH